MAKAEFKKGQQVNVYHGDFYTAAVTVTPYIVSSCGLKQLHMIRTDSSNAEFRISTPFRGQRCYSDVQCASVDPVAHALVLRRQFAEWTREHFDARTKTAQAGLREGTRGALGYAAAIAESRAKFEAATADL